MNKTDLANVLAERKGMEKKEALDIVNELISIVKDNVLEGERVYLRGFGSFYLIERKPRKIRTPNGDTITTKQYKTIRFKSYIRK